MMRAIVLLCFWMALSPIVHAGTIKSLAGLWVVAKDNSAYTLQFEVQNPDPTTLMEELRGTLRVRSVSSNQVSTSAIQVTGQYLVQTGIVMLNIGEPGARREYAIGDTRDPDRKGLMLRIFRVRPAQGIMFEQELFFEHKRPPQTNTGI